MCRWLIAMLLMISVSLMGNIREAQDLENQMWENMSLHNWQAVEDSIADNFQGIHWFGIQNREAEISLVKELNIQSFKISDLTVTEGKDTYIVTYWVSVVQTLNKMKAKNTPFPRISVWQKIDGKWKWVAHANMNPRDDTIQLRLKTHSTVEKVYEASIQN